MKQEELKVIIENHGKWLRDEDGGIRANLSGCDLSGCDLHGSDLSGSDLRGSDLSGCDLSGCDLSGCDLSGCYLRGSDLSGCDLRESDLRESDLRGIKEDFFKILSTSIPEIEDLKLALIESRVNGSTYTGECCCLIGTIANIRHCDYKNIENDSNRPAERWFLAINETCSVKHPVVAITLEWIEEFKKMNNL